MSEGMKNPAYIPDDKISTNRDSVKATNARPTGPGISLPKDSTDPSYIEVCFGIYY